jgi:AcrR family transcriptional regulator
MPRLSVEAIRREQLLDAAIALVAAKGYDATTVRDIAAAVAVAPGTVLYYFQGRDDLMQAALVEAARRFGARLDDALAEAGGPAEAIAIHAVVATPRTDAEHAAQALWIEFWRQALRNEELRALHERLYDSWRARIAATVREGVAGGVFRRDVAPEDWARRFVALLDGLGLHVVLHPGSVTADVMERACREHVAATLLR